MYQLNHTSSNNAANQGSSLNSTNYNDVNASGSCFNDPNMMVTFDNNSVTQSHSQINPLYTHANGQILYQNSPQYNRNISNVSAPAISQTNTSALSGTFTFDIPGF